MSDQSRSLSRGRETFVCPFFPSASNVFLIFINVPCGTFLAIFRKRRSGEHSRNLCVWRRQAYFGSRRLFQLSRQGTCSRCQQGTCTPPLFEGALTHFNIPYFVCLHNRYTPLDVEAQATSDLHPGITTKPHLAPASTRSKSSTLTFQQARRPLYVPISLDPLPRCRHPQCITGSNPICHLFSLLPFSAIVVRADVPHSTPQDVAASAISRVRALAGRILPPLRYL